MKTWKEDNLLREAITSDLFSDDLYEGDLTWKKGDQIKLSNEGYKYAVIYDWGFGETDSRSGMPTLKNEVWKLFKDYDEAKEFATTQKHPYGGTLEDEEPTSTTGWFKKLYTQEEKDERDRLRAEEEEKKQASLNKRRDTLEKKALSNGFKSSEDFRSYQKLERKITKAKGNIEFYSSILEKYKKELEEIEKELESFKK